MKRQSKTLLKSWLKEDKESNIYRGKNRLLMKCLSFSGDKIVVYFHEMGKKMMNYSLWIENLVLPRSRKKTTFTIKVDELAFISKIAGFLILFQTLM